MPASGKNFADNQKGPPKGTHALVSAAAAVVASAAAVAAAAVISTAAEDDENQNEPEQIVAVSVIVAEHN